MNLQCQVGHCTDVAQELDRNLTTMSLPDMIKLPLFYGYESEANNHMILKSLLNQSRHVPPGTISFCLQFHNNNVELRIPQM